MKKMSAGKASKKKQVKDQVERIKKVFDMSTKDVKRHPQLKKIQKYIEAKPGKEKYAIGNGDTYIVYKPEYDVSAS